MKAKRANDLLLELRRPLKRAGTREHALGARAYMKCEMPFHGVTTDELRSIAKREFARIELEDAQMWQRHVLAIWRGAKFREEWYCAVELAGDRRAQEFHTLDTLAMFEEMIVGGAWWDIVDNVAGRHLGMLLERHPKPMTKTMLAWSRDKNLWKRRSSIICQLKFKERIDLELLYACIEPSLASKEFFLRKAIGWALRQHAWTDSDEVVRYVRANRTRLSGLSKREALKNVLRSGRIAEIP